MPHTPGPWRWNLRHTNGEVWDGPGQGYMIAQVFGHGCKEVADANGQLISASPDMREAVEKTYDVIRNILTDSQLDARTKCGLTIREWDAKCKAALAKAYGREAW